MRGMFSLLVAFGVLFGLALVSLAGDETLAIVNKAIVAHGIKGKDEKKQSFRGKNKGTIHIGGMDLEFNQEVTFQMPNKFKEMINLNIMGNNIVITSVFDGKQGWIKAGGKDVKVENELLDEFKEAAYSMSLAQDLFLKDGSLNLNSVGEVKVKDRPALGIRITKEGQKDLSFFFDKETGLLAKVERRARDFTTGQEMTEERIIVNYQEVEGRKIAKKVEVLRDGKPYLEAEVLEGHFLEELGDAEFAKPE